MAPFGVDRPAAGALRQLRLRRQRRRRWHRRRRWRRWRRWRRRRRRRFSSGCRRDPTAGRAVGGPHCGPWSGRLCGGCPAGLCQCQGRKGARESGRGRRQAWGDRREANGIVDSLHSDSGNETAMRTAKCDLAAQCLLMRCLSATLACWAPRTDNHVSPRHWRARLGNDLVLETQGCASGCCQKPHVVRP